MYIEHDKKMNFEYLIQNHVEQSPKCENSKLNNPLRPKRRFNGKIGNLNFCCHELLNNC